MTSKALEKEAPPLKVARPVWMVVVLKVTPAAKVVAPVEAMLSNLRLLPFNMPKLSLDVPAPNPPAVSMNLAWELELLGRKVKEADELAPEILVEIRDILAEVEAMFKT